MKPLLTICLVSTAWWPSTGIAEPSFHFYGAEDCPPCMAFKRNHLQTVQRRGAEEGFAVVENTIPHTKDVPNIGSYGAADSLFREALAFGDLVAYPSVFFVTDDERIISVHSADWAAALSAAVRQGGLKAD